MTWEPGRLQLLLLMLSVCVRVHSVPIDREAAAGGGEQDDKEGVTEENVVRLLLPRDSLLPSVTTIWANAAASFSFGAEFDPSATTRCSHCRTRGCTTTATCGR